MKCLWSKCILSTISHPIPLRSILTLFVFSHLNLGLPRGIFPSDFPSKIFYAFLISPMRTTWPARLNLLHSHSQFKTFSSAPCSQTLPIYALLLVWETNFHTHTKGKVKLSLYFNWTPRHEGVLGEWRYSFTHCWPRYQMEVRGQLETTAAFTPRSV